MKISVRISYEAKCASDRGTSAYIGKFHETVELEIAETESSKAPPATETRWGEQTRWYDSRHFLPRYDEERRQGRPGLSTEEILDILKDGQLHGLNYGYDCFERKQRPSMFDPSRYIQFDYRARDRAIAEAQLCFERLLIIDGDIWVECAEPYLIREQFGFEVSHDIPADGISSRPNHRALNWLFHANVLRADDPAADGYLKVLIPESIRRQPERETIIDAAKFLLEDYSYIHLWDINPRVFSALGQVQSLFSGRSRADIDCEALVEPVLHLVDEIERNETLERICNPGRLAGYRNAVSRWLDRDMSVSDILPAQAMKLRL
ncbi:hypothetical protein GOB57_20945 [Sinorhizobium meliloti]|nr:hypothetical protein [Sinorhizobium meliloti]